MMVMKDLISIAADKPGTLARRNNGCTWRLYNCKQTCAVGLLFSGYYYCSLEFRADLNFILFCLIVVVLTFCIKKKREVVRYDE
jgi:hypothetical protein